MEKEDFWKFLYGIRDRYFQELYFSIKSGAWKVTWKREIWTIIFIF